MVLGSDASFLIKVLKSLLYNCKQNLMRLFGISVLIQLIFRIWYNSQYSGMIQFKDIAR